MKPFLYSIITRAFIIYIDQNRKNAIGNDLSVTTDQSGINFIYKKVHAGNDQQYAIYIRDRGFLEAPSNNEWARIAAISNSEEKIMTTKEIKLDSTDLETLAFDIKEMDSKKGTYQIRTRDNRCFLIKNSRLGIGDCNSKSNFYIVKQDPSEKGAPMNIQSTNDKEKNSNIQSTKPSNGTDQNIIIISPGKRDTPSAYTLKLNDQGEVVNFKKVERELSQQQEDSSGHDTLHVELKRNKSSRSLQMVIDEIKKGEEKRESESSEDDPEIIRRSREHHKSHQKVHHAHSNRQETSPPTIQPATGAYQSPAIQPATGATQPTGPYQPTGAIQPPYQSAYQPTAPPMDPYGPPPAGPYQPAIGFQPTGAIQPTAPPMNSYGPPPPTMGFQQPVAGPQQQPPAMGFQPQSPAMSFLSSMIYPQQPQMIPPPPSFDMPPSNQPDPRQFPPNQTENPILDKIMSSIYKGFRKST